MNDVQADLIGSALLLAIWGFAVIYTSRVVKKTNNSREKQYLLGISIACLLFALMLTGLIFVFVAQINSGEFDPDKNLPKSALPFAYLLPASLIVFGTTNLVFSKEAVILTKRRRHKNKIDKWIVTEIPKREHFIKGGIITLLLGFLLLITFVLSTIFGY